MKKPLIILTLLLFYGIQVRADVCSITVDTFNFGNYQPFINLDLDATSNIYLNCRLNITNNDSNSLKNQSNLRSNWMIITLSTGSSGNYNNRKLQNNSHNLFYNLYKNNSRTRIWGNGTNNSSVVIKKVKTNRQNVVKIYGRIPHSQSIPPGVYTDNIFAEITY